MKFTICCLLLLLFCWGCSQETPVEGEEKSYGSPDQKGRNLLTQKVATSAPETKLPPTGKVPKKLIEVLIQRCIDEQDFKKLDKLVNSLKKQGDYQVRLDIIDALANAGSDGVLAQAHFLKDEDPRVVSHAARSLDETINNLDNSYQRSQMVRDAVIAIQDEDVILSLLSKLEGVDPPDAVRSLMAIWSQRDANPKAAELALKQYEFITGEEFVDLPTAFRWIREHKDQ